MPEWIFALIVLIGMLGAVFTLLVLLVRRENRLSDRSIREVDLMIRAKKIRDEAIACCPEEEREWLYARYWGGPHAELASFERSPAMQAIITLADGHIDDLKPHTVFVDSRAALVKALSSLSERLQDQDDVPVPPKHSTPLRPVNSTVHGVECRCDDCVWVRYHDTDERQGGIDR